MAAVEKTAKHWFAAHKLLIVVSLVGLTVATGCGGGDTSSGGDIFSDGCEISDPAFPFCGGNWVRCRNQDQTLYQVFDTACPAGWTVVPEDVAFPNLACTNPQGQTFNVDADQCPRGWREFTLTL